MFRNPESFTFYTHHADQATTPPEANPEAEDVAQFVGFMRAALEATPLFGQLPELVQEYIVTELTGLLKKELTVLRRPHANNLTSFTFTIKYATELRALKQRIHADIAQLSENPISASKLGGFITNTFKRFTRYIYLGEVLTDEQIKYRRNKIIRAVWHKPGDSRTTKTIEDPTDPERDKTNPLY